VETVYLIFKKTIVQKVRVVKLGVYNGGGNDLTVWRSRYGWIQRSARMWW